MALSFEIGAMIPESDRILCSRLCAEINLRYDVYAAGGRFVRQRWFLGLVALALSGVSCIDPRVPPNVLLISIDTLRADHLGSYGYARDTSPAIDQLAAEGALFETVVSTTSWTLPAHASMFTSLPQSVHGCDRTRSVLAPERLTLAEVLRDAGYTTAGFWSGPYLHPRFGLSQGFDVYERCSSFEFYQGESLGERGAGRGIQSEANKLSHGDVTNPRVVERVSEWLRKESERPFFLFVHMWDVHYDYIAPAPFAGRFTDPDYAGSVDGRNLGSNRKLQREGLPPNDLAQLVALYDGEIAWTDHHVGAILEVLGELGFAEDTIVVLTSDHGEEFFEHDRFGHKYSLYDESLLIPLIIRYPPAVPPGRRVAGLASVVDLMPTILELAGLEPLLGIMGSSLVPVLHGSDARDDVAVAELVKEKSKQDLLAVRTDEWKWIVERRSGVVRLYDLRTDPGEQNDRARSDPTLWQRAEATVQSTVEELDRMAELNASVSTLSTEPMSPELRRQLESLGYLEAGP